MKDLIWKVVDVTHNCHIRWQKVTSPVCSWSLKHTGSLIRGKAETRQQKSKSKFTMQFKTFAKLALKKKSFFLQLLLGKDNQIVEYSIKRSQLLRANCSGDSPGNWATNCTSTKSSFSPSTPVFILTSLHKMFLTHKYHSLEQQNTKPDTANL